MTFSSMAAPKVVYLTTFGAAIDENVVKISILVCENITWDILYL